MNPLAVQFCTCAGLRKAGRVVTQFYEEALKECGVKPTQFSLLATLDQVGSVAMGELAKYTVTDRTTLTRNLKPLHEQGWVRFSEGEDRRRRQVELTAKGKKTLERAQPLWRRAQERAVGKLGKKKWEMLMVLLDESVDKLSVS
jgi:DNA-binding MarR family transcriptional regulator